MFPTIRDSAAVVSIILLLMLFLPPHYSRRQEANRGCAARGVDVALGALASAVLLRPRAGLSGCGLYNAPGRAFSSPLVRPLLSAFQALRGTSAGASMSIPGGVGTRYVTDTNNPPPCSAAPASLIRSELPSRTGLRPL